MIQSYSVLKVADNSGARLLRVIKVLRQGSQDQAGLGDVVVGSVRLATPRRPVKTSEIVQAVIVRQTHPHHRKDGTVIRFDDNAVVVINADGTLKGTRVFGPVARELQEKGFGKIVSLAPEAL
ncbi:MAG: 50S ribosomal protein L14 [Patescibacteria group bacterium]